MKKTFSQASPLFIITVFFITILVSSALVWRWSNIFIYADKTTTLTKIPATSRTKEAPTSIQVGLSIGNFNTFDIIQNKFIFDGILWFKFDPSLTSLATVSQAKFENAEILEKSEPHTKMQDGMVFVRYDVRVSFTSELSYKYFPIDNHKINLTLVNKALSPSEALFVADNRDFIINPDLAIYGWHKVGQNVHTGYIESPLDKTGNQQQTIGFPAVTFIMEYARLASLRNTITLLLPLFILYFLFLFTLVLDSKKNASQILTINISCISGLIGFRFVMEALSPKVGYFMYSDYFFLLFLAIGFIIFFINIFASNLSWAWRRWIIVAINGLTIGVMTYLLYV